MRPRKENEGYFIEVDGKQVEITKDAAMASIIIDRLEYLTDIEQDDDERMLLSECIGWLAAKSCGDSCKLRIEPHWD